MSRNLETQLEYPEVIGWRQRVGQTRRRALPAIATAGLVAITLANAAFQSRDNIYGSLPPVVAAREEWMAYSPYQKFTDLQNDRQPFGVKTDRVLVDTTIDLVLDNINKRGGRLKYSAEELKASMAWLPEDEFIEKYIWILTQHGYSHRDERMHARMSPSIMGTDGSIYYNSGYTKQALSYARMSPNNLEAAVKTYKTQMVVERIVQMSPSMETLTYEPVRYTIPYMGKRVMFNSISGLTPVSNDISLGGFQAMATSAVTTQILSELPGFDSNSYIGNIAERENIQIGRAMHRVMSMDFNDLTNVYFGIIPVSEYLTRLGGNADNSLREGVRKIISYSVAH